MIHAVFFDLDGTLYDRDAAILRMAEEQFETFREELGIDKPVFMERLMALDGRGHKRTPRLHHALADMLGFVLVWQMISKPASVPVIPTNAGFLRTA